LPIDEDDDNLSRGLSTSVKEYQMNRYYTALTVTLALLGVLAGCSDEECGCGAAEAGPAVISTYPGSGDTGVPPDTFLTVVFDRKVDPATVTTASFTLEGPGGQVTAVVSVDSLTAILTPASPLAGNSSHTARIDRNVTDLAGNEMDAPYSWSFTTGPGP
jgi:hypothetical protein